MAYARESSVHAGFGTLFLFFSFFCCAPLELSVNTESAMSDELKTLKIPSGLHQEVRILAARRNENIGATAELVVRNGLSITKNKPSTKTK